MSKIYDIIRNLAQDHPHKIALTLPYKKNGSVGNLTYQELVCAVDIIAKLIKERKYKNIALLLDNSKEWIFIDLACMKLDTVRSDQTKTIMGCLPTPEQKVFGSIGRVLIKYEIKGSYMLNDYGIIEIR